MKEYEKPLYQDEELLNSFLNTWSLSDVKEMTLEQYTDVKNQYTFTQWVEGRTRSLGSIKGISSFKFGIYKRRNPIEKPKTRVYSNDSYSWLKTYGECGFDEEKVFEKVRERITKVIERAQQLDFESVEKIDGLYNLFKWKIAFLYSNQSMVPVFNRKLLLKFTREMGMVHSKNIEYAKVHRFLYDQKPPNISIFNFMRKLFYDAELLDSTRKHNKTSKNKRGRKGTYSLNTKSSTRKSVAETVVTQHHKKIQLQLKKHLKTKYPDAEITFEKNYIDLLLITPKEVHYYEVKTAHNSETCIKQGLGQLLSYSHHEEIVLKKYQGLKKKIVIFGKWKARKQDLQFIDFIKNTLKINFEYFSLEDIQ